MRCAHRSCRLQEKRTNPCLFLLVVTANLCPFVALFSTVDTLDFYPSTPTFTLPKRRFGRSMDAYPHHHRHHCHCRFLEELLDMSRAPSRARTRTPSQTDAVRVRVETTRPHLRKKRKSSLSSDSRPPHQSLPPSSTTRSSSHRHRQGRPRGRERAEKSALEREDVVRLAEDARRSGSKSSLDDLAGDILAVSSLRRRVNLFSELMTLGGPLPSHDILTTYVQSLSSLTNSRQYLEAIGRVVSATLDSDKSISPGLVESLARGYTERLRQVQEDPGAGLAPESVRTTFHFVQHLAQTPESTNQRHALAIFQKLIETQYVPPEAVHDVDLTSQAFSTIVTAALVRSCIFWNWRVDAGVLTKNLLRDLSELSPSFLHLCTEVIYSLLEYPSARELELCISIVKRLGYHPTPHFFPDGVIRKIYNIAHELEEPDTAQRLYTWTLTPRIHSLHNHPLPRGPSLPWLLARLLVRQKQVHLGRTLIHALVSSPDPIPPSNRAQVILLAAEHGFASDARTLWERYSVGRHKALVVAHAALAVRMTSLFSSLVRREAAGSVRALERRARLFSESTLRDGDDSEMLDSLNSNPLDTTEDEISTPGADNLAAEDPETRTEPAPAPVSVPAPPAPASTATDPSPDPDPEDEAAEARMDDLVAFSCLLVARLQESKLPLREASHRDLNALARVHFLIGNVAEGFAVFQVLLNRHEIPDNYDVNVAMTAMAEYDHRHAARMLRTMAARGVMPDGVAMGTVIHHALLQRDTEVIKRLLSLAKELGLRLTLKTVNTLIRASVTLSRDDPVALRENLKRALGIVEANLHANRLPTIALGKFCIVESLRAQDPEMAYRYWELLVKDKAEWTDNEQQFQRSRIARRIENKVARREMGEEEARAMLGELRSRKMPKEGWRGERVKWTEEQKGGVGES